MRLLTKRRLQVMHEHLNPPGVLEMLSKYIPLLSPSKPLKPVADGASASRQEAKQAREKIISTIKAELASEPINLARLAEKIDNDPGLKAHLVTMANSSYFGLRRHIVSAKDALLILGLDATRHCVMTGAYLAQGNPVEGQTTQATTAKPVIEKWADVLGRSQVSTTFADTGSTGFPHTIPVDRYRSKP